MTSASDQPLLRLPPLVDGTRLSAEPAGSVAVVGSAERGGAIAARLGCSAYERPEQVPASVSTVIAVGGGRRLDAAKVWRAEQRPGVRLIAVPTLFGSGADASPIAVIDDTGQKTIRVGPAYLPDGRWIIADLAAEIPEALAVDGCGDAWSHALEGLLSPLASDALRDEIAGLIRTMLDLPLAADAAWLDASALACAAQARSGVGLVHGIAHQLEAPLRREQPDAGWGHARLCALFLVPVMGFNRAGSDKLDRLLAEHGLDADAVLAHLAPLFDADRYRAALPQLQAYWRGVLRDPCTRVNSRAVRPGALDYFTEFAGHP